MLAVGEESLPDICMIHNGNGWGTYEYFPIHSTNF